MYRNILVLILSIFALHVHAIHVVFRLDDPTLQHDSVSLRAVKLFNQKQVPLSIAMVACNAQEQPILPEVIADSLYISKLQSENIELTLHGYNHQDINHQGEFGGLSYAETQRRIRMGGGILQQYASQKINTFVPPFNAYNDSTLVAMMDNGLHILSADMFGVATNPNIQYYPETLGHLMQQKGIWTAAEEAIFDCCEQDAICVVMFHAYDLPDEASWTRLASLLDACKANDDVQLHTFRSLYESGEYSSHHRYRANQLHSLLQKHWLCPGVLHTTWLCWLIHLLNALLYAMIPFLFLAIGKLLFGSQHAWRTRVWLLTMVISLVFCGLAIFQVGTPMKLLGLDILVSCVTCGIAILISKLSAKRL